MSDSWISDALRELVRLRASRLCEYCLLHELDSLHGFQVDHVIAEKHEGPTQDHNLCFCCATCNRAKGSDIATLVNGKLVRLFNPRIDVWADHFKLHGPRILARSPIGAATIKLLDLNDIARLQLRESLIAERKFPSESARKIIGPT